MDKRHSRKVDTEGVRPVITMAGIMPGGSEMRHWHENAPFPDPDAIARQLAAGKARSRAALARQKMLESSPSRQTELGVCMRPDGNCPYESACTTCPYLRVDEAGMTRLLEIEAETEAELARATADGRDKEASALIDTLAHVAEKKARLTAGAAERKPTAPA